MSRKKIADIDSTASSAGKIIKKVLSDISERKKDKITGLPSGYTQIDKMLSGLNKGNLIVVAGHPGIGKTAFALRISEHLSIDNDIPVLFFSMGLYKERLIERMLLGRAKVNLQKALEGTLKKQDLDTINKTAAAFSNKPLYIDDTCGLTTTELRQKAQKFKKSHSIKLIIVDSLQKMRSQSSIDLCEKDFAQIAKSLKLLALELNIPVLLLADLTLDLLVQEGQEDRVKPIFADLGKAMSIDRYADELILINRESYYMCRPPDRKHAQMMILKARNESTGTVSLIFNEKFARFEDVILPAF